MSNIGSTALQTSKQEQTRTPAADKPGRQQQQFMHGTRSLLDNARQVAENAVGQGMQLNPIIYQMLGLSPRMVDHSADLSAAQQEMDLAQQQFDQGQQQIDQLKGLPKGKRSKAQKKQLRQLKKGQKALTVSLEHAKDRYSQLETMPNQITGFDRLDPSQIDASSPFSAQNPLYQAQQTESQRLNQYLAGGEVDPTLKQQWTSAEQALRAQLTQRFGPDYESTSVGQMALQNFSRSKNEAFATWNQQQVEKYNQLAFGGAADLQKLLAGQIALMREPSQTQMGMGTSLSNLAPARLQQEQTNLQERSARKGLQINTSGANPAGLIGGAAGGLGQLLTTPYNARGDTLGGKAASGIGSLYNWATGANAVPAYETAAIAADAAGTATAPGAYSWMFGA